MKFATVRGAKVMYDCFMNQVATASSAAYVPGVCNINKAEISYRRKVGYISLAVLVVLVVIFLMFGLSRWYRLILFLPATLSASGFLQAKNHFCVGYGAAGKQNASDGSDKASRVADQEAITKDKKRASTMNRQSVAIGFVVTLLSLLMPVF